MNERINKTFLNKKKKFVTFVTGGDPNINSSLEILKQLVKSGSDIIEIGMPFSDPMADGPTIQLSSIRAIKQGVDLNKIFNLCKEFRKFDNKTPIILMGYYNPIHFYGNKKFIEECSKSQIDGLIIVDLQPENDNDLIELANKKNIAFIRLITPTTNDERLKQILPNASGFLYYVSITGVTGASLDKLNNLDRLKNSIEKIKEKTDIPIIVGFGIKTKEQVQEIFEFADGVVVGSSIIKIIEKAINEKSPINKILNDISFFIKSLLNKES